MKRVMRQALPEDCSNGEDGKFHTTFKKQIIGV